MNVTMNLTMNRAKRKRRGYTVVEVMMALSVLSIGITGIVAMQKITLISNTKARDLAVASAIASSVIERLRYDALRWNFDDNNNPDNLGDNTASFANTQYLNVVRNTPGMDNAPWLPFLPGSTLGWDNNGMQGTFDVTGMDSPPANANDHAFCVNYRLTELMYDPIDKCNPVTNCPSVLRAEVRVYWLKLHSGYQTGGTENGAAFCAPAAITNLETTAEGQTRYHFVYMTSTILRNDVVQP